MKIVNYFTHISTRTLRHITTWCCDQLSLPQSLLGVIQFGGDATDDSSVVYINFLIDEFPSTPVAGTSDGRIFFLPECRRPVEAILVITAFELVAFFSRNPDAMVNFETLISELRDLVEMFRTNQESLLRDWEA